MAQRLGTKVETKAWTFNTKIALGWIYVMNKNTYYHTAPARVPKWQHGCQSLSVSLKTQYG